MNAKLPSTRQSKLIWTGMALFIVLFAFLSFDGYEFYDDYHYIKSAYLVTKGEFQLNNDHFNTRWAIIYLLAPIIHFFGINDFLIISFPLAFTLLTGFLIWRLIKSQNHHWALWASFFFMADFYTLWFSRMVYPDVLLATFCIGMMYILWRMRQSPKSNLIINGALFGLLFLLAFLTKLTVIYIIPFVAIILVKDIINKQNQQFWFYTASTIILGLTAYAIYFHQFHGHPFARFIWYADNHYTFQGTYHDKSMIALLYRITMGPIMMFIHNGQALYLLLAAPIVYSTLRKGFTKIDFSNPNHFWSLALLTCLIMIWFMPTSWKFYSPAPLQPRHFLFVVPIMAITAANGWIKYQRDKRFKLYIALGSLLFCLIAYNDNGQKMSGVYLLIAFLFGAMAIKNQVKIHKLISPIFILILLIHPIYSMVKPSVTGYHELKTIIEELKSQPGVKVIYTHEALVHAGEMLMGFEEGEVKFSTWPPQHLMDSTFAGKNYFLINTYYINAYPDQIAVVIENLAAEKELMLVFEDYQINRLLMFK